jgi:hypothetical protein
MSARALLIPRSALGLVLLLAGCVVSVEPVIPESEAIFDARLLGTWEDEDANRIEFSTVMKGGVFFLADATENVYAIRNMSDDGSGSEYLARLGRLGGHLVLEVFPHFGVRGHLLLVLAVGPDEIHSRAIDAEPLLHALDAGDLRLAYRRIGRNVVLRDSSATLRDELARYLARPGVMSVPRVFRRIAHEGLAPPLRPGHVPCYEGSPWPEADQLFRRDPRWLGTDAASSVDLGGGRILWLFGDSWIDTAGRGERHHARRVSNTVALQAGTEPVAAAMSFHWGTAPDGAPAAFFPEQPNELLRLGNGVRVGDRLVLFFARFAKTGGGGREPVGWGAIMVTNPDDPPSGWRTRPLKTPANAFGVLLGHAGVLHFDGHVYAFGPQHPVSSRPVYVARWPDSAVRKGDLRQPEWWAGETLGWVPESSHVPRWPVFEHAQTEMTIHHDLASGRVLAVQTLGDGPADLAIRAAPTLVGPWTEARMIYRPSEYYRLHGMIHGARAHPDLTGGDLVLSYAMSSSRYIESLTDPSIHYPRFLRLTRCDMENSP